MAQAGLGNPRKFAQTSTVGDEAWQRNIANAIHGHLNCSRIQFERMQHVVIPPASGSGPGESHQAPLEWATELQEMSGILWSYHTKEHDIQLWFQAAPVENIYKSNKGLYIWNLDESNKGLYPCSNQILWLHLLPFNGGRTARMARLKSVSLMH